MKAYFSGNGLVTCKEIDSDTIYKVTSIEIFDDYDYAFVALEEVESEEGGLTEPETDSIIFYFLKEDLENSLYTNGYEVVE